MTKALSLSLGLAARLLERSSDGMFAFDHDIRCIYWGPSMERLVGLKSDDVLGQALLEMFPFLTEVGEDQCFRRALAGEEVSTKTRPFYVPGTNRRGFFNGRYSPYRDETGRIVGGIALVRDVTAERRASELINESENRFRNMADVAPVLLWMSSVDGLCTFFNQTWLDFTGRTQEEEWGVGWAAGIHFEDLQRCMDTYTEAFNERRTFEMEYRLRRADGQYRWLLDRGTPRCLPDGSFAGFIGSCIDITDRRELEGELRRAVQARDEFLSIASHELKTPLTSLQLQIENLNRNIARRQQSQPTPAGTGPSPLDKIQSGGQAATEQVRRLAHLVDLLLDVSRINSGRLRFDYTDCDFGQIVHDAIDRWRPIASGVGADLVLSRWVSDGGSGLDLTGSWDRLRLEQILNNLVSNAVKYGPSKPIHVRISGDARSVRLEVADNGIGIKSEDTKRIFERFERAVSSRNYGGLGLGLWITHEIVSGLGGSIGVQSEPGKGSTFTVELPRRPPVKTR
ncbi:MAG TPA: PAS domain-containing sensor histidine kinase [Polyangia bacterium]